MFNPRNDMHTMIPASALIFVKKRNIFCWIGKGAFCSKKVSAPAASNSVSHCTLQLKNFQITVGIVLGSFLFLFKEPPAKRRSRR